MWWKRVSHCWNKGLFYIKKSDKSLITSRLGWVFRPECPVVSCFFLHPIISKDVFHQEDFWGYMWEAAEWNFWPTIFLFISKGKCKTAGIKFTAGSGFATLSASLHTWTSCFVCPQFIEQLVGKTQLYRNQHYETLIPKSIYFILPFTTSKLFAVNKPFPETIEWKPTGTKQAPTKSNMIMIRNMLWQCWFSKNVDKSPSGWEDGVNSQN